MNFWSNLYDNTQVDLSEGIPSTLHGNKYEAIYEGLLASDQVFYFDDRADMVKQITKDGNYDYYFHAAGLDTTTAMPKDASFAGQVILGDLAEGTPTKAGVGAGVMLGFVPVVNTVTGARDTVASAHTYWNEPTYRNWVGLALSSASMLPVVGGFAKCEKGGIRLITAEEKLAAKALRAEAALANAERASARAKAVAEGIENGILRKVGKKSAGVVRSPFHHVFPDEFRTFFEAHGFTGAKDIDGFTRELELSTHQAIHGGGDWKLGRLWEGEWNQQIMKRLDQAEAQVRRTLNRDLNFEEVMEIGKKMMKEYKIDGPFVQYPK